MPYSAEESLHPCPNDETKPSNAGITFAPHVTRSGSENGNLPPARGAARQIHRASRWYRHGSAHAATRDKSTKQSSTTLAPIRTVYRSNGRGSHPATLASASACPTRSLEAARCTDARVSHLPHVPQRTRYTRRSGAGHACHCSA